MNYVSKILKLLCTTSIQRNAFLLHRIMAQVESNKINNQICWTCTMWECMLITAGEAKFTTNFLLKMCHPRGEQRHGNELQYKVVNGEQLKLHELQESTGELASVRSVHRGAGCWAGHWGKEAWARGHVYKDMKVSRTRQSCIEGKQV